MPLAQVLKFDQRLATGRRRTVQAGSPCVILQLFRAPVRRADPSIASLVTRDDDQIAGRSRDPG